MDLTFSTVDIDRFDELNIFNDLKEKFNEYKNKRINLIKEKKCDIFVAMINNRYIGEITAKYINEELDNETIPNIRAYFEAFRIIPEYQNKGIGTKLLQYAIKTLEQKGYTEFTIGVEIWNKNALHIYKKAGFTKEINRGIDKDCNNEEYILYLREKS